MLLRLSFVIVLSSSAVRADDAKAGTQLFLVTYKREKR